MKKKKIFFVFGYGDGPESSLCDYLKKFIEESNLPFEVYTDYYAQYSPDKAKYDIENYIDTLKIDLLIGENIGGYICSIIDRNIPKLVINPIIDPGLELDEYETITEGKNGEEVTIKLVPEHIIKFYKESELKPNFEDCHCIVTSNEEYEKCKNKFKNIRIDDDFINFESSLNNIKEGN